MVIEELVTEIMGLVVSLLTDWSCHCLISFVLKSGVRVKPKTSPSQLHPLPLSFKWNNIFKTKFLVELSSQQVVDHLNKFSNACLKDVFYDVDDAVKDLSDVVFSVAKATLPVKSGLPVLKKPKNSRKRKNKWFDKSCFELKREILRIGKLSSKCPSDPSVRGTFLVIKKIYKKLDKTKKRSFKEFLLQKIASFESDNPKDFWEMVNELRQKSANQISDKIDAEEWFTYFRKLSTPHNSAKSGFEKLVDFNVSKIAEFPKSNEPILDEPITLEEIRKASTKLKTGKAAGNDSISNDQIRRVLHWACIANSF